MIPSAELNCLLPGRPGRPRARLRDRATRWRSSRASAATSPRTAAWITAQGGVAYLAHPYWTGATPGDARAARHRLGHRGLQRRLRARARPRALHRPLGRAARRGQAVLRARDRRQPPPGLRLRPRLDLGPRPSRRVDGVLDALRTGCFYSTSGPRITSVVAGGGSVEVQCDPCRSVTVVFGVSSGAAVNAGRLGYRYGGEILATTPDGLDHGRAARPARERPVRPGRGRRTPAAAGPGRTHCDTWSAGGTPRAPSWHARPFDLLVIGSGIVGAGIASEAARLGLRVALVDRSDFGGATSSASSKLIHGGLRYLRLGDVKLVREAHAERRALLRVVAPHLVRRIPFLFPRLSRRAVPARDDPGRALDVLDARGRQARRSRQARAGAAQRSRAAPRRPSRLRRLPGRVDPRRAALPRQRDRRGRGRGDGAQLRRGRRAATGRRRACGERSCTIGSRARPSRSRRARSSTRPGRGSTRCAGSRTRASSRTASSRRACTSTLPLDEPWSSALTIPHDQVRVTFAYPWEGMLLLGTTDTPYEGDPAEVAATEEDIDTVLAEAGRRGRRRACCGETACWRPTPACACCPRSDGSTVDARRETAIPRRQRRDADGRRRQADDVPADRPRRARAPRADARARPARPAAGAASGRDGCRQRRRAPRHAAGSSSRPSPPISPTSTGRGRTGSSALAADRPELLERLHPDAPGHRCAGRLRRAARSGRPSAADVVAPSHDPGRPRAHRRRRRSRASRSCSAAAVPGAAPAPAPHSDWIGLHTSRRRRADDGDGRGTADVHPSGRQGEGDRHRPLHGRPRARRPARREVPLRRPHARADHADRRDEGARPPGRARGRHPRGRARRALRRHGQGPPALREGHGALRGRHRRRRRRDDRRDRRAGRGADRGRLRAASRS